ncbi:hypothetical protein FAIPA1_110118 [Frankia sp. AiPs1]
MISDSPGTRERHKATPDSLEYLGHK